MLNESAWSQRLKLKYDGFLSSFAFDFNLRCNRKGVLDGTRLDNFPLHKPGKIARHNYKLPLAYFGPAFAGWAWMPSDRAYMVGPGRYCHITHETMVQSALVSMAWCITVYRSPRHKVPFNS